MQSAASARTGGLAPTVKFPSSHRFECPVLGVEIDHANFAFGSIAGPGE